MKVYYRFDDHTNIDDYNDNDCFLYIDVDSHNNLDIFWYDEAAQEQINIASYKADNWIKYEA